MRGDLRKRAVIVFVFALAIVSAGALGVRRPWAVRLPTIVRGGPGPPTILLLHGYGSSPADWEQFTRTISVPASTRFVFPEAPETTVPPDGPIRVEHI